MSVNNQKYIEAAEKCLIMNIPFALFMYPDENTMNFVASKQSQNISVKDFCDKSPNGTFAISTFIPDGRVEVIVPELTPEEIAAIEIPLAEIAPNELPVETTFESYSQSGNNIISQLKNNGGKVVLSRIFLAYGDKPVSVAISYFKSLPSTFRSIFFTPEKGIWLGATPEILATYSIDEKKLKTMALAGTRPIGYDGKWDDKNIEEHNFVTDFIKNVLCGQGSAVKISSPFSMQFGSVEHLCENIEAYGVTDFADFLRNISPTPAVCGTPRDFALKAIQQAESHSRECYGGWLGVKSQKDIKTFVNLRCAKIYPGIETNAYIYSVFAGGGFTAQSVIEEEWSEATQKASSLLKFLKTSETDGQK